MSKSEFATAAYSAFRLGEALLLTATGTAANLNDQFDFETIPTFVPPNYFGFRVIHGDIQLPATKPFTYSEWVSYPTEYDHVTIIDAEGRHQVEVHTIGLTPGKIRTSDSDACVFKNLNADEFLVLPCDSVLPAIYKKVFGPASKAECDAYVAQHGGA